jgi:uncharacterized protein YkwD
MKPILALFIVLAACRAPVAPASVPPTPKTSASSPLAEEIVTRTKAERRALHLPDLARSAALMKAAQLQAEQMAAADQLDHQLPRAAYPTLESRLAAVGYVRSTAGENIAEGYSSAESVVAGWMKSPGHRQNIVSTAFTEMGAGAATAASGHRYHVQVFARPQ